MDTLRLLDDTFLFQIIGRNCSTRRLQVVRRVTRESSGSTMVRLHTYMVAISYDGSQTFPLVQTQSYANGRRDGTNHHLMVHVANGLVRVSKLNNAGGATGRRSPSFAMVERCSKP
jgi:hypothetical protein